MLHNCCLFNLSLNDTLTGLTTLSTIALAVIAYIQIKGLNKTARADFLNKLKEGFFTKESRQLITLIETNSLTFFEDTIHNDFAVFKVNIPEHLKEYLKYSIDIERKYYTTQEIDDLLLGHFEDAGLLLKNKIIDIKDANQQFEFYVNLIYKNKEIIKYIRWIRSDKNEKDTYSNFQFIYEELKEYKLKSIFRFW